MTSESSATLLRFLLWDWLASADLFDRPHYAGHDRVSVDAVLDMAERHATDMLAANARAMDIDPPRLDAGGGVRVHPASARAVRALAEYGFFASVFDEDVGGLQLPQVVHAAMLGINMAGCVATASYLLLTVGNARLIVEKGTPEQIAAFAVPQIAGTAMGTMCLSEPQAGSALGAVTTRAVPDGEDTLGRRFRIKGDKMWISGGDQDITDDIVHLVLAKVPDASGALPEGSRGLSLFIVPKRLPDGACNDIAVTGLNHKLGQRALPNCALAFGEESGAVGWLLGEVGQGLAQMFQMMNDARIAVGMGGAMLALRGYRLSLAYAADRIQGSASGKPVAIIEHPDVKRMLLAQKAVSEGALALVLFGARLLDEEQTAGDLPARRAAGNLLGLLTPAIKSWPSEFGQEALHDAIQVLGGAGYTIDHEVEKLWRDNRLNPIHEGTTGIQAIDLIGRKMRRDGGSTFALLSDRIESGIARARLHPELINGADTVAAALARLRAAVTLVVSAEDEAWTLSVATPLLHAFGHVVVAWLWLDQMRTAAALQTGDDAFHVGRRHAFNYYLAYELPRIGQWLHPIERPTDVVAAMRSEQF